MNIAIDETMVPHKGKLAFKQYIKNKPTKWGVKLWVLSEATTGYVYRFQVYLGKEHGQQPEKHLARRVVRDLTVTETGKNHHLYMDNFYTDPHFFLELFDKKILACGTVRQNRKQFPKDLIITTRMQKQMDPGDYLWRAHMRLVATAWNGRRVVYHLSTTTIYLPFILQILMVSLLLSKGNQLVVVMLTSIVLQLSLTIKNIWAE